MTISDFITLVLSQNDVEIFIAVMSSTRSRRSQRSRNHPDGGSDAPSDHPEQPSVSGSDLYSDAGLGKSHFFTCNISLITNVHFLLISFTVYTLNASEPRVSK